MRARALAAGVPRGAYAESRGPRPGVVDAGLALVRRLALGRSDARVRYWWVLAELGHHARGLSRERDEALRARADELRLQLVRRGLERGTVAAAFALAREQAGRCLARAPGRDELLAAAAMLEGHVAELPAGADAGPALALAACTAALGGKPVHVVSPSDAAAAARAEELAPLYRRLGLRAAVARPGQDAEARRAAYAAEVLHVSHRGLALDYLRDRHLLGPDDGRLGLAIERLHRAKPRAGELLLRGLACALVEEADAVLIDDAPRQLVVSDGEPGQAAEEQRVLARIGLPRLFRRYLLLGGVSASAVEARGVLGDLYGLAVVRVGEAGDGASVEARLYRDGDAALGDLAARVRERKAAGAATLLLARDEAQAADVRALLTSVGLAPAAAEPSGAGALAAAGRSGRVTLLARLPERGARVALEPAAAAAGGLAIVAATLLPTLRSERQLLRLVAPDEGRATLELFVGADDPVLRVLCGAGALRLASALAGRGGRVAPWLARPLLRRARAAAERRRNHAIDELARGDDARETILAFGGRGE